MVNLKDLPFPGSIANDTKKGTNRKAKVNFESHKLEIHFGDLLSLHPLNYATVIREVINRRKSYVGLAWREE